MSKKRILLIFTALILFIGITAACGNSEDSSVSAESEPEVMVLTVYNNAGDEIAKYEGNDIKLEYEQHHIRSGTSPYINIIVNGKEHQYHNVSITNIPKYP